MNIRKGASLLQGKEYGEFGTQNMENRAKSIVRKINCEAGLTFAEIEALLVKHRLGLN